MRDAKEDNCAKFSPIEKALAEATIQIDLVKEQLKAADELAAAWDGYEEWLKAHGFRKAAAALAAYLRLRETAQAQPETNECSTCGMKMNHCDCAQPADSLNQCDGCQAGRPFDKNGNHRMGDGTYPDLMRCQRYRYSQPAIPQDAGAQHPPRKTTIELPFSPEDLCTGKMRCPEAMDCGNCICYAELPCRKHTEGAQEPETIIR
jgi:hypothetical protein